MILEDDLGITLSEATQTLEATIADAESTPLLNVRVGDPLLRAERTVFDTGKHPVEYVSVLYRADKYFYSIRLKRKRSKTSVGWKAI